MKKIYYILSALFLCVVATSAQEAGKTVVIKTNSDTTRLKWGYIFLLTRLGWRADLIHTLM